SLCGGESEGQKCVVRVVIAGKGPLDPKTGVAFDSVDSGGDDGAGDGCCTDATAGAHSVGGGSPQLVAAAYTVRAQYAVEGDHQTFTLDNWTFSAEKIEFGGGD